MLSRVLRNLLPSLGARKRAAGSEAAADSFGALAERGLAHYLAGALQDAAQCWRDALRINPRDPGVLFMLGALMHQAGEEDEALDLCTAALEAPGADAHESYALMFANRGYAYAWVGDLKNATPDIERALELAPDLEQAYDHRMFASFHDAKLSPETVLAYHREWAQRFADPLAPRDPAWNNVPDPERRLRIGYVSPDFRDHALFFFFEHLLERHDRGRFEVLLYSSRRKPDKSTERLRSLADGWRDITAIDDAAAARMVREDGIDILIDLAGHMGGNRLKVFAYRPAPVQMSYIGYLATTGMRAIDYYISDELADPVGMTERHYSENLLRLPRCLWCYRPPPHAPQVEELPARKNGYVTFGSFNKLVKLSDEALSLWARVLNALPDSRLLIGAAGSWHGQQRITQTLGAHGIDEQRIEFASRLPYVQYLGLRARADISLDAFPHGGGTTTCETLWMGVPVVTRIGAALASRAGYSLLHAVGLDEHAAFDDEQFVACARRLASDLDALAALRAGMRERILASSLCDEAGFAAAMEHAYRGAWRTWCASRREGAQPAERT